MEMRPPVGMASRELTMKFMMTCSIWFASPWISGRRLSSSTVMLIFLSMTCSSSFTVS